MKSRSSKTKRRAKPVSERKRLSGKELKELKAQIAAGNEAPSIARMKLAYEADNWDFLRSCAAAHWDLDPQSLLSTIYLGIAYRALERKREYEELIRLAAKSNPSHSKLSYAVARWYSLHGYKCISMSFYAMHLYLSSDSKPENQKDVEFEIAFEAFQRSQGIEPTLEDKQE
ncbi:hypothetical protein [Pelagicoccus sp. SDUM812003]|uniref:hypothetical protein n=1 Tax=Pelagicoccus sp. SDUM812003 TaxID=3041267 RepID=UPI00280D8A39|nr:hypothetical protein [Pelagicoccus sp. SDUM812003]MDQ8203353.1 hypothetical protein [Pelagicoccus sp. SDUM812003]